jgi:Spy/CpxP family protein refolding chaperone
MKTKLSVFLLFAASAFAQTTGTTGTPHGPNVANMVARLTTILSLTSAQQTQATTIFTNEQTAVAPIQAQVKSAHTSLATAVKANDTATIDTVTAQVGTFEGQLMDIRSKAQAAFYAILTADQQTKYTSLHGMGGFAGPGGPAAFRGMRNFQ